MERIASGCAAPVLRLSVPYRSGKSMEHPARVWTAPRLSIFQSPTARGSRWNSRPAAAAARRIRRFQSPTARGSRWNRWPAGLPWPYLPFSPLPLGEVDGTPHAERRSSVWAYDLSVPYRSGKSMEPRQLRRVTGAALGRFQSPTARGSRWNLQARRWSGAARGSFQSPTARGSRWNP